MAKAARIAIIEQLEQAPKTTRAKPRKKRMPTKVQVQERLSFFSRREWIAFSISFAFGAVIGSGAVLGLAHHLKSKHAQKIAAQTTR